MPSQGTALHAIEKHWILVQTSWNTRYGLQAPE